MKTSVFFITIVTIQKFVFCEKLNQEFLQGFETGILVRDDARAFRDFSCPTPETDNAILNKMTDMIMPMKMLATMTK